MRLTPASRHARSSSTVRERHTSPSHEPIDFAAAGHAFIRSLASGTFLRLSALEIDCPQREGASFVASVSTRLARSVAMARSMIPEMSSVCAGPSSIGALVPTRAVSSSHLPAAARQKRLPVAPRLASFWAIASWLASHAMRRAAV